MRGWSGRWAAVYAIAIGSLALSPAGASALTLGTLDPAATDPGAGGYCVASQGNLLQGTLAPDGTSYTVPQGGGTLTSWSTRWGIAGADVALEVWRSDPTTTGGYFLIAQDSELLSPGSDGISTYAVSIPVHAGDVIGLGWPAANSVHCAYNTLSDANGAWGVNGTTFTPGMEGYFGSFIVSRDRVNVRVNLQQTADLAVSQVASRASVTKGNAVNFVLRVADAGPAPVTATLTDALPAGLRFYSAAANGGSCGAGQTVSCELTLAPGTSETVSIVALASSAGTQKNVATISSSATDATPADNSSATTVQVISIPSLGPVHAKVHGKAATLSFSLDQAATVTITIGRHSVKRSGHAGVNRIRLAGLSRGRHMATVVASTSAGKSRARHVSFRIS